MRVLRLIGALLAAAAFLVGCSDDESRPDSPSTTVNAPPSSAPPSTAPPSSAPPSSAPPSTAPSAKTSAGPSGSEGFTVRYLDSDGKIQTLQPKDFPR